MAQQTINNGDSGLDARNKLNGNFTELYASISQPNVFTSVGASFSFPMTAGTFIDRVFLRPLLGQNATIQIGTSVGGSDVFPAKTYNSQSVLTAADLISIQDYLIRAKTLYFTISAGTFNIRIETIPNCV